METKKNIMQSRGWAESNSGIAMVLILSLIPIILWLTMRPAYARFLDFQTTMTSIGQLSGLVGMAMFALSFVLSARMKAIERFFGGMGNVYYYHRIFASAAFLLLLVHPVVLALRLVPTSVYAAASFLVPIGNWTEAYGWAALVGMMSILVLTFSGLKYHVWKLSHKFGALVFFFALLHTFLVTSDVSLNMYLRWYVAFLSAAGASAVLYRTVFNRFTVIRHEYVVKGVKILNSSTLEISMAPKGGKGSDERFDYNPGQFVFVSFHGPEARSLGVSGEEHPFSIVSSPKEPMLKIAVKELGDYTSRLKGLQEGAVARIEGPFGMFFQRDGMEKDQLWVAGGIGIAPFLSMLRSIAALPRMYGHQAGKLAPKIDLYYCTKDKDEAVYLEEILALQKKVEGFRVISFCSRDGGERKHINADIIESAIGSFEGREVYMCGPSRMMNDLKKQFIAMDVPNGMIHFESFDFQE
jgi:predicted ferric reductase